MPGVSSGGSGFADRVDVERCTTVPLGVGEAGQVHPDAVAVDDLVPQRLREPVAQLGVTSPPRLQDHRKWGESGACRSDEGEAAMAGAGSKLDWNVFGSLGGVTAAVAAPQGVGRYLADRGEPTDPPGNPDTTWGEPIGSVVLSGIAVAVTRLLGTRTATTSWRNPAGALPPGMKQFGA